MASKTKIVDGFVESDIKLDGKTAVITGSNTGIGYETALDFARRGAKIVMACRDIQKAEEAKAKILEEVSGADLVIKKLDLSSLDSVRECARDINETESRIDILVNNAGIMLCPHWETKEGYEMQLGVNHIGHFLFTNLLLDLIKKSAPSRIINLSSIAHAYASMDWNNLMQERNYNSLVAYGTSKLANVLHCVELSKKLEGTGVTCYCVHPGIVQTELARHVDDLSHVPFFYRMYFKLWWFFYKNRRITPKQGAQTTIYCAIAPELANESGKYYADCAETPSSSAARKPEDAAKLWDLSEEWTKPNVATEQTS